MNGRLSVLYGLTVCCYFGTDYWWSWSYTTDEIIWQLDNLPKSQPTTNTSNESNASNTSNEDGRRNPVQQVLQRSEGQGHTLPTQNRGVRYHKLQHSAFDKKEELVRNVGKLPNNCKNILAADELGRLCEDIWGGLRFINRLPKRAVIEAIVRALLQVLFSQVVECKSSRSST